VVSIGQYANTLRRMVELAGFKDSSQFFNPLPIDFSPPPQPPKPTPEETLAAAQAEAVKADMVKKAAELQLKEQESLRLDARERDKIAQDGVMRRYELELKYNTDINDQATQLQIAQHSEQIRRTAGVEQAMVSQMSAAQPPAPEMMAPDMAAPQPPMAEPPPMPIPGM
jgi:small-conductance mechanosensitive channel